MCYWRFAHLGESPPWEQFVGEVRGLVLLGVWRCGVRLMVLLGEPWKRRRKMLKRKRVKPGPLTALLMEFTNVCAFCTKIRLSVLA